MSFFTLEGMSEQEARDRIYLVDSQGLVYTGRGELAEHKECAYLFVFPSFICIRPGTDVSFFAHQTSPAATTTARRSQTCSTCSTTSSRRR
jgi:hypothetical protein